MKGWLARWDVTPAEQVGMSFGQVLTIVNLRRIEIVCLLGFFSKAIEVSTGFRGPALLFEVPSMIVFLIVSLAIRRSSSTWLARGFVAIVLCVALFDTQWVVAAMGAYGRLTSAYPLMLLSLALLFVLPPGVVAAALAVLFLSYCQIVLGTLTRPAEQVVAIVNTAIVSVIAVVAAALNHSGRRRDYEQKREIQHQNARLIDRSHELDMLMAITAHDLRSPLYGLRNLFDLAVRRAPQEPDLPLAVLKDAMASIDAMLGLTTRLMDAHAAEHRPLPCLVDEDIREHVMSAVARIGPLARSMEVSIGVELPDHPLIATLDAGALAQVLDNLLSNGVRFSPAGSILRIAAAKEGRHASITVRDRGPGIAPAQRNVLFKKFHRNTAERSDVSPGSGMGLFIAATLAERMGAAVRYEPNIDAGTTFVVTLSAPGSAGSRT